MKILLLLLTGVLIGLSAVVVYRYMRRWRDLRKEHGPRLLPLHIWSVALSYDLLLVGVYLQVLVKLRWWHPIVYIPAVILGIYAMIVINAGQTRDEKSERRY